jgi:hypothetical protein
MSVDVRNFFFSLLVQTVPDAYPYLSRGFFRWNVCKKVLFVRHGLKCEGNIEIDLEQ